MSTKVSALASLLYIQPFSLAWMVMMFRLREHPNAPQMYAKVLTFYWLVGLLVALGLGVVAPGLVSLLGRREFPLSPSVVTVAALAAVLSGAMYPVNVGIYLRNRTSAVVPAFAACALLSVALGWAVVPTWGVTGAAACLLGTYAVQTFLLARINARLYPIPWEWMRLSKATGASVIAYGATLTFGGTNGSLALAIRGLVFCCTALLCLRVFRFFGEGELAAIWVSARRALD
jgi:O-antigen/teichoic acid export membrane protein